MPYITDQNKGKVDPKLTDLLEHVASDKSFDAGHLNYVLTRTMLAFVEGRGLRYAQINAAIGAVECAKMELYRRVAGPYEDVKIAENGDVYSDVLLSKPPKVVHAHNFPYYDTDADQQRAEDDGTPPKPSPNHGKIQGRR